MSKSEDWISTALDAEDRALLDAHAEPGYFRQAMGLFRGRMGWVMGLCYVSALAGFIGMIYALVQAWSVTDPAEVVRWGIVAVMLLQVTAMLKLFMGEHLEANRTLREIKRVELQVALLRSERSAG